ncbi:MAG: HAMP domain-containing sensor histidine kinase [Candidatus Gracilibacteria bacterium]|nr:HAMP domain-containing sensor histidine kinase [Candidatus Gracilibacteria bacterium]
MTLARKFIISLILSITFIASINILAFYFFYSTNLKTYISEKIKSRDAITIEYINEVIEKQTVDDIDSIFTDTEIEFFELLENNNGKIPLTKQKNIDIVINYLVKSGISSKYIEEIVPTDNFGKVLEALRNKESLEYKFVNKMAISILFTNIVSISIIIFGLLIFIRNTILPIKEATENIKNAVDSKDIIGNDNTTEIEYHNKKDEIGLLITAINSLNKSLNMQAEIRSRLLADISHELKTPITSIQCYLEGIMDGVIKLNEKNLKSITDEMKRLITLVNRIMDFEKSDKEKLNLDKSNINISEITKQIVETHKKRLKENKQRIKVSGDENQLILADSNLFKQVVHNIIGNFLKYAGKDTLLNINITKKYIDFIDNGQGIKSSELPFLTEKFYQGNIEKTGDISSRGIGVGLSITSKIILAHGWKYEIKSDKGKGFSFKIYL